MYGRNRQHRGRQNLILSIICIFLFIILAGLLYWSRQSDAKTALRIRQLSEGERENSTAESGENETNNLKIKETENKKGAASSQSVAPETEGQDQAAQGIVCWGDDLINGVDSDTYSYKVVLQRLLTENGYGLDVVDKTLQGAGTLSMMTMAGVAAEDVQQFISAHEEASGGAELYITEKGIRDLTPEQTERNDLACIPVIFMGYYGGWNHDPQELAQQQRKILDTFPQTDRFIIAGTRPVDGSVDSNALDSAMNEVWGEHYISLAALTASPASTHEAQEILAQAVFDKLVELNYITK